MRTLLLPVVTLFALITTIFAEAVKDREGAVRSDRENLEKSDRWIYNDLDRGFAEAAKNGRPVLVVLRCVPCLACRGIDASILSSQELQPLLDQFNCVRIINANALDLSRFQFDYDLSFSTSSSTPMALSTAATVRGSTNAIRTTPLPPATRRP